MASRERTRCAFIGRRSYVVVATALVASCRAPSADIPRTDTSTLPAAVELRLPSGLVQRVALTPATPVQGQNVSIKSMLRNGGAAPITLSSRTCGLDYEGSLKLIPPPDLAKCEGYSMQGDLAPGDSVLGFDTMRVDSPPGEYTLRVRHALGPEAWYELKVRVSAAGASRP